MHNHVTNTIEKKGFSLKFRPIRVNNWLRLPDLSNNIEEAGLWVNNWAQAIFLILIGIFVSPWKGIFLKQEELQGQSTSI